MVGGFGYSAFVIDAYAGVIAGWECSLRKTTALVERAIRGAVARRAREGHPLCGGHDSSLGCRIAIHCTAFHRNADACGLIPSVGTVADALDNALCETTIGLYKTECSPFRIGPIRILADLEHTTCAWVSWYNSGRLMHRLGRRPPTEAEADYYARVHASNDARDQ
jgi:putative transposase